jgi:G3E family GTPase
LLLENGCACCAASEDLTATLERLFWQRLHRTIPPFSWVLIETTGIADPQPIITSLQSHELIAERYEIAGVITTFDARRGPAQLLRHPECESQLAQADGIVLTKTDIATTLEMERARAAIRSVRPDADVMTSSANRALPASIIVAALNGKSGHSATPAHSCHHDHDHTHDHGHAHHSNHVTSAFARLFAPLSYEALSEALQATLAAHETAILRVKGTAPCGVAGEVEIIQAMPGEAIARSKLSVRDGDHDRAVGMTFIAQDTAAGVIACEFLTRLGLPASVSENMIGSHALESHVPGSHAHGR